MDHWDKEARGVAEDLARRVPDKSETRKMLAVAGIDVALVDLDGSPATAWHHAVVEARKQGRWEALLDEVRRLSTSPRDRYLLSLASTHRTAIELPTSLIEAFGTSLVELPAESLHVLSRQGQDRATRGLNTVHASQIVAGKRLPRLVVVGESGIGKTSLLSQLVLDSVRRAQENPEMPIPLLVLLGGYTSSLDELILTALRRHGWNMAEREARTMLAEHRVVVFADAYDEAYEESIWKLDRELRELVDLGCGLIVTTRPTKQPRLNIEDTYTINALSDDSIKRFIDAQLGGSAKRFMAELRRNGLMHVASNTMLLVLLILLFRRDRKMPATRAGIVATVIDQVQEREDAKSERFKLSVPWKICTEILAALAFDVVEHGDGYHLDLERCGQIIRDELRRLEDARLIRAGLSIDDVLDRLQATGFVRREAGGIVFWHRALLEHFATQELVDRLDSGMFDPLPLAMTRRWTTLLAPAIARSQNAEPLVRRVLAVNGFLAGFILAEDPHLSGKLISDVLDFIVSRTRVRQEPIRRFAVHLLARIPCADAEERLKYLVDSAAPDVRIVALDEVVRRQVPGAVDLALAHRDWNIRGDMWTGSPLAAVVNGLALGTGVEIQNEILNLWRKQPGIDVQIAVEKALLGSLDLTRPSILNQVYAATHSGRPVAVISRR